MAKTKISEFSATPGNNTDIDGINIAEGCAPSGINNAIRELMSQLKDFQTGAAGDSFNGPVGTTTAAAGAFTTLSASGAVTLSGGTANGVPYLNGSKVLTSGSALTFDGANLNVSGKYGVTGNGNTPTSTALEIGTNGAGSRWLYNVPTGGEHNFTVNGAVASWVNATSSGWLISGSEQMRLTSTGLGIGTSSPATKLHVNTGSAGYGITVAASSQTSATYQIGIDSNSALAIYDSAATAQRLVLSNSGNLGLGVTPSAWDAGTYALQFNGAALYGFTGGANLTQNAFYGGAWKYVANGAATYYSQLTGSHRWYTAPSGTAGNAISFTQAMTLTAAGRLGVGTTAPQQTLHAYGNIEFGGTSTPFLYSHRNAVISSAVSLGNIEFAGDTSTTSLCLSASIRAFADGAWTDSSYPSNLRFLTTSSGSTDPTERMRLSSDGNLGLGVTPSAWGALKGLDISSGGALFGFTAQVGLAHNAFFNGSSWRYKNTDAAAFFRANALGFEWHTAPSGTAGNTISFTQAMTLDASGNLALGATSANARLDVVGGSIRVNEDSIGTKIITVRSNFAGLGPAINVTTSDPLLFLTANTERARIDSSGNFGIGTTIPASYGRLAVNGTASILTNGAARFYNSANNNWSYIDNPSTDGTAFLRFATGGGEAMRLDSSGNLIQSAPTTPPTLATNGTMVFNLTSNTNLRVSVRGSDGVTRTANITLA